jgi:hypothetical protein
MLADVCVCCCLCSSHATALVRSASWLIATSVLVSGGLILSQVVVLPVVQAQPELGGCAPSAARMSVHCAGKRHGCRGPSCLLHDSQLSRRAVANDQRTDWGLSIGLRVVNWTTATVLVPLCVTGWMHAGYPIMAFMSEADRLNLPKWIGRDNGWGWFHELGKSDGGAYQTVGKVSTTTVWWGLCDAVQTRCHRQAARTSQIHRQVQHAFVVSIASTGDLSVAVVRPSIQRPR